MNTIIKIEPSSVVQLENKYMPSELYAIGDLQLISKPIIAIVGARKATQYSKNQAYLLSKLISESGGVVVSGGAMGIDAAAHDGAYPNTIAVLANGVDINYPKSNKELLNKIRANGLIISEHEPKTEPTKYGFVARNRIIVGMSKAVVIVEAELDSGSMRSYEWAQKFNIPVYVIPQRLNESGGTNRLLRDLLATPIYDFNEFIKSFGVFEIRNSAKDEILEFCKTNPTYEEAYLRYEDKILEYELDGKIKIEAGIIKVL